MTTSPHRHTSQFTGERGGYSSFPGLWAEMGMDWDGLFLVEQRELLKGPLYYACVVALTTIIFWRTSPISIAVICNLCAGDGVADIVGRQFGHAKLPHNAEKSYAGNIAMFLVGFVASDLFMCYFHRFGFVAKSWTMVIAFGAISLVAAIVESLPISTRLDDNLTVPLATMLVGGLVFYFYWGQKSVLHE